MLRQHSALPATGAASGLALLVSPLHTDVLLINRKPARQAPQLSTHTHTAEVIPAHTDNINCHSGLPRCQRERERELENFILQGL